VVVVLKVALVIKTTVGTLAFALFERATIPLSG